jgi:Zn-dependent protease
MKSHRWSVRVARVAGIDVRVHVTFLLLVALFGLAAPEPGVLGAAQSIGWLLAVFSCVVVHEFAHSLVARRRGGEVHEILLFPLGGVSKLDRLPESPGDELAIAIAGPLASIGLALTAAALALVTGGSLFPPDLLTGGWLERLAWLNLLLAGFNLLPAFPLDGGRVLRALLERRMDLEAATRAAARVGHGLALTLVAAGVLFDVWLVLIGIFVYFGASAEEAATIVHVRLRGHTVGDAMRPGAPETEPPAELVVDVDAPLDDELVGRLQSVPAGLAVRRAGRIVGTLRLEDVLELVRESGPPTRR